MLRNKYFHWSSNASNTINGIVHKPRISTAEPHEKKTLYNRWLTWKEYFIS